MLDLHSFPKTVTSIGSGQAFLEKCFGLMGGVNVKCYDREPLTRFLPVEQTEFFEVQLTDYTMMGPPSFIQFYNWPSSVNQLMFDSRNLEGLCSDIELPRSLTSSSR